MKAEDYQNREQAYVKHWVLKNYLQKLAFKVGQFRPGTTLNYIDGFSGPWDAVTEDATDSSPYIASRELATAQHTLAHARKPIALKVRAMFVEQDVAAYQRLDSLRQRLSDIDTEAHHGEFETRIDEAIRFARSGTMPFAFVFIDPTGWTGYALATITPLLQVKPGEVMINFMTKDIIRFIDDESSSAAESFDALFGGDYRRTWRELEGPDREDAIVNKYCDCVKRAGGFSHVVSSVVLNPQSNRTHYHLIYGTRSDVGLVTFREIEAGATQVQRKLRAAVRTKARTMRTGQGMLAFEPEVLDTDYVGELRQRYQGQAKTRIRARLIELGALAYDQAVIEALQLPLTSERDLKAWVTQWREGGDIAVDGLKELERQPKRKAGHRLRWLGK